MSDLRSDVSQIIDEVKKLLADPAAATERAMPAGTFFLKDGGILALPRDDGDSRYPYGQDGFNFWAYTSGYMHANEGLFSYFLRAAEGQEPKIAFFAGFPKKKGGYAVTSILPVPILNGSSPSTDRFSVLTMNCAYYVAEVESFRFVVRVHVDSRKRLHFSLQAENMEEQDRSFFLSSFFNPYLRHQIYESGEDRWFKEIRMLHPSAPQKDLGSFSILVNEDKDRHHSVTNYAVLKRGVAEAEGVRLARHEETVSRYQYVGGVRSGLNTPAALFKGTFGEPVKVCTFVETAVAADLLHFELGARRSLRMDYVFEMASDAEEAEKMARLPVDASRIDAGLQELEALEKKWNNGVSIRVDESTDARLKPVVFNNFFEHLKKQVEFCSLLKGYIQLSENSLIGIRDVFQAIEAMLFWRPAAARKKMLEALDYTSPDGRCFRQYSLPSKTGQTGRMDLRMFIDQGAWVISCVATYLRVTGDWDFLKEPCGYHRIVDEKAGRVIRDEQQNDTVLDHLIKIMDFLLLNRDHQKTHCVLALYGDWNDALDGLGISQDPAKLFGTGVSGMATLQVFQNIQDMVDILKRVNALEHGPRIEEYLDAREEIQAGLVRYAVVQNENGEKRILHGWGDKRAYLVGSYYDPDGKARDGLTSNAFWILSGMYDQDPGMQKPILDSLKRLDSKYGFKTFEPAFPPNTHGVGRIGKLPPGTAENGATYIHATAFAIMALFRIGCAELAWEQLLKILPFTDLHDKLSHSPFVMPNSYGFNPEKGIDGQNMNDWQTGSSNVVMKLLIRYVFGFEPMLDGIWIQPAAWLPFKRFDFRIRARGVVIRLTFENRGANPRKFMVNGLERKSERDAIMGIDKLWIPYSDCTGEELNIGVIQ